MSLIPHFCVRVPVASGTPDAAAGNSENPPAAGVEAPPGFVIENPPAAGVEAPPGFVIENPPAAGVEAPPVAVIENPPAAGVKAPPGFDIENPAVGAAVVKVKDMKSKQFKVLTTLSKACLLERHVVILCMNICHLSDWMKLISRMKDKKKYALLLMVVGTLEQILMWSSGLLVRLLLWSKKNIMEESSG
jgi:hypothetical protein